MKRRIPLILVTAMFAAVLSGCGNKRKNVADDFMAVQGTTASASDVQEETSWADDSEDHEQEDDSVDLPIDATVEYGDKKANLYFDLQKWPSDIAGPIDATEKEIDEAYIQNFAYTIFDNGKYTIETVDAAQGELLKESTAQQGTTKETTVSCRLVGTIDGTKMDFYYNSYQVDGELMSPCEMNLYKMDEEGHAGWVELTEEEVEQAGGNSCDKNEALRIANDYLNKWGFDGYECVSDVDIKDAQTEGIKPNGYSFAFRKKIGASLGAAYQMNCFYNPDDPQPTFFGQILFDIIDNQIIGVNICDVYELGSNREAATLIDKDEALELGTKAIEQYLNENVADSYIVGVYENKHVWDFKVDLSYVPVATDDSVSYRAMYIFSLEEGAHSMNLRIPIVAIDAISGTDYMVDYFYSPDDGSGASG